MIAAHTHVGTPPSSLVSSWAGAAAVVEDEVGRCEGSVSPSPVVEEELELVVELGSEVLDDVGSLVDEDGAVAEVVLGADVLAVGALVEDELLVVVVVLVAGGVPSPPGSSTGPSSPPGGA